MKGDLESSTQTFELYFFRKFFVRISIQTLDRIEGPCGPDLPRHVHGGGQCARAELLKKKRSTESTYGLSNCAKIMYQMDLNGLTHNLK